MRGVSKYDRGCDYFCRCFTSAFPSNMQKGGTACASLCQLMVLGKPEYKNGTSMQSTPIAWKQRAAFPCTRIENFLGSQPTRMVHVASIF